MSDIAKTVGHRIRNYRLENGYSQEKLADLAGCHPTYIGQLERGEKNATLESIEKIAFALRVPLSRLFEKIDPCGCDSPERNIPLECYEFMASRSTAEQEILMNLLVEIGKYKSC